jgi:hypothetical protein
MSKSVTSELREKIYASMRFITRGFAIPEQVIVDATDAALKVIHDWLKTPVKP